MQRSGRGLLHLPEHRNGGFPMDLVQKSYEIRSEKYGVKGTVGDYGRFVMLKFESEGKQKEITVRRPSLATTDKEMKAILLKEMESYIEKVLSGEIAERRLMFHYWYVDEMQKPGSEVRMVTGHGFVTGHPKLRDSAFLNTSLVREIEIDEKEGMAILHTKNSAYYCPLAYCDFDKQDGFSDLIPDYERLREKYYGKMPEPETDAGNVLLVLSNFDPYYFHSLVFTPAGSTKRFRYHVEVQNGLFQDSFLIEAKDYGMDLRYYLHFQSIEFFSELTGDRPLFIENIGDVPLCARTRAGAIRLMPGERKEVKKENAEKEDPTLLRGNMIPTEMIY